MTKTKDIYLSAIQRIINGLDSFVSGITEHLFFPPQLARHYEGFEEK